MFVGIDVSKDRLDVHLRPGAEAFSVARDGDGIEALCARLRDIVPELVVIEATGGFETVVAAGLAAAGLPLAVVNPRQIRDFAKAVGRLAKTDPLDAEIIAHFAEAIRPQPRPVPDAAARALGELVARRRQIIEMMGAERNRRRLMTQPKAIRTVERVLATLQAQLADLDNDIDDNDIDKAIRGTPAWRAKEDLLTSVPGIGPKIARTLIAELPELGHIDRRSLAALAGLAPFNQDSGRRRGRRAIAGGRSPVRTALFMAVLVSIRRNMPLAQTYHRMVDDGKPPKVAIVACMRKLLGILNAILREQTPWQNA